MHILHILGIPEAPNLPASCPSLRKESQDHWEGGEAGVTEWSHSSGVAGDLRLARAQSLASSSGQALLSRRPALSFPGQLGRPVVLCGDISVRLGSLIIRTSLRTMGRGSSRAET